MTLLDDWTWTEEESDRCGSCHQIIKEYKRKLTASHMKTLVAMVRAVKQGEDADYVSDCYLHPESACTCVTNRYVHVRDLCTDKQVKYTDYSLMELWGIISRLGEERGDGVSTGWWAVTELGIQFLNREIQLQKYKHVRLGEVTRASGPFLYIDEVWEEYFNLDEVKGIS